MTTAEEIASSVETPQQVDTTPTQMESGKNSFEAAIQEAPKDTEPATGTVPEGADRPEETTETRPEAEPTTEAAEEETSEVKNLPIGKVSLEEIPPATEAKEQEPALEMKKETESAVEDPVTFVPPKEEPIAIDSAEVVKAPPPETIPEAETAPPQHETPNASA